MPSGVRRSRRWLRRAVTGVKVARRYLSELTRPSRRRNDRRLADRGEHIDSLTIRPATTADVKAVAELHVATFNETHVGPGGTGPSLALRESQWRDLLTTRSDWFCYVLEDARGRLVGFTCGHPAESPEFRGRLNKIYLLREYQRLGLGTRLVKQTLDHFLSQGITSMVLFTEVENPACWFYEALGGERQIAESGEFEGMYGWHDIRPLAAKLASMGGDARG